MASYDFDLFVIGAGSGGVRAARLAGALGKRVAVAEESRLGGTCVNRGCIPKKLYAYAAHYAEDFEDAAGFGWTVGSRRFDWTKLVAAKEAELARLNSIYARTLGDNHVVTITGRARLRDAHTVEIDGQVHTAETILVCTGGRPQRVVFPGSEHIITSDEAFDLPQFPKRVIVAGGGYIALEFASIFHGLGAQVTLIYRGRMFLRYFDHDLSETLFEEMGKKGVQFRFEQVFTRIEKKADGLHAFTTKGQELVADVVMMAVGRVPNTGDMGLDKAGVALDEDGAVIVDEVSRTDVPNIYAIGDVTNRLNLTPVAIYEAHCLIDTLYKNQPTPPDHRDVATAVFSNPPVAAVGLTEKEARRQFGDADIYRARFKPLKHTLSGRNETTLIKLVVDPRSQQVVGAHMVGPEAAEIIQGFAVAVKAKLTKQQFDATLGIHPTAAEEFVQLRQKIAPAPRKAAE
jgi:glutathione reductase (NADPH)